MQTRNKVFDDISQLMTNAMGVAQGAKEEAETAMKGMIDRWLADRDFVTREEFDAVRAMAQKAREENEALKACLDALEKGSFRTEFKQLAESFSFSLRGNDDAIGPFEVEVLRRPWIEGLTFTTEPPPHTGESPRTFGVEAGSVSLPQGTRAISALSVPSPKSAAASTCSVKESPVFSHHTTREEGGASG